jgi:hypothetical protein
VILGLDRLAADRVMVDLDLAAILVETIDFVAVAFGDLELADLVALILELGARRMLCCCRSGG